MLILPRKLGESIVIGDGESQVAITVVDIGACGTFVRLGITAPRDTPVYRPDAKHAVEGHQARRASGGH